MTKSVVSMIAVLVLLPCAGVEARPPATSGYAYTSCVIDSDADGLADCYETNTHVYVIPFAPGTDPTVADTDGDSISDGDEVNGTSSGLNLPGFGVNPLHKDILLEYYWMAESQG